MHQTTPVAPPTHPCRLRPAAAQRTLGARARWPAAPASAHSDRAHQERPAILRGRPGRGCTACAAPAAARTWCGLQGGAVAWKRAAWMQLELNTQLAPWRYQPALSHSLQCTQDGRSSAGHSPASAAKCSGSRRLQSRFQGLAPSPSSRSAAAAARRAMLKPTGKNWGHTCNPQRVLSHSKACRPAGFQQSRTAKQNQAHRGRCCRPRTAASTKWSRGRLRQRAPAPGSGTACPARPRLRPQQVGRGKEKVRQLPGGWPSKRHGAVSSRCIRWRTGSRQAGYPPAAKWTGVQPCASWPSTRQPEASSTSAA